MPLWGSKKAEGLVRAQSRAPMSPISPRSYLDRLCDLEQVVAPPLSVLPPHEGIGWLLARPLLGPFWGLCHFRHAGACRPTLQVQGSLGLCRLSSRTCLGAKGSRSPPKGHTLCLLSLSLLRSS